VPAACELITNCLCEQKCEAVDRECCLHCSYQKCSTYFSSSSVAPPHSFPAFLISLLAEFCAVPIQGAMDLYLPATEQIRDLWQSQPTLPAVLIGSASVLLLAPRLRQTILDVLETIIASLFLVVLIVVVLGLPFGEQPGPFRGPSPRLLSPQSCCSFLSIALLPCCTALLPCCNPLLCSPNQQPYVPVTPDASLPTLCCDVAPPHAAAIYIAFKGVMFTLRSITGMTYLHDLVSLTAQAVARHT
jgi:hypothetical protein